MAQKRALVKAFKIHAINSDGGAVAAESLIPFEVIDPATRKPFVDDETGLPCVVMQLKPISQAKYRHFVAKHTERIPARKGQPPSEDTDWDAVQDACVAFCVTEWTGLVGADDKPLQCVLDAKLGLPGDLKNEIVAKAMQGEAVDVTAASFRQP